MNFDEDLRIWMTLKAVALNRAVAAPGFEKATVGELGALTAESGSGDGWRSFSGKTAVGENVGFILPLSAV
jgi:hypothetical protein